jgi:predicted O-methyltransferase YrrM
MNGDETVLPADLAAFVRAMAPETDAVFDELAATNRDRGFPTVGPEVGGLLRLLARLTGARRVFEFGSGLGYSAYWVAPALPPDGEIVLTDFDADNLDAAREFLERGGYGDLARFEVGDALETYRGYDGPFDLVLVDNLEGQYVETFETVRDDVPVGGVVCADNVMTGAAVDDDLALAAVEGDPDWEAMDDSTKGIVEYLLHVRDDPEFETILLPLGEGVTVSVRTR